MTPDVSPLDLGGVLPPSSVAIEASAGTGKTYSLSALVARHVAERDIPASGLLIVTFTRAAAAELRDRTRRALVRARDACASGVVPDGEDWLEAIVADKGSRDLRLQRLAKAVAGFDDATISTIHGFCQQALTQIGVRADRHLDATLADTSLDAIVAEVCRDIVVADLAVQPDLFADVPGLGGPAEVLTVLRSTVGVVLRSNEPRCLPDAEWIPELNDRLLARWCAMVDLAVLLVAERRRERGQLVFDDLVVGLRDALVTSPHAAQNCQALAQRFPLVFIDESQDTDPLQWQIFTTAFDKNLVTVGDPKQAIYRFRGADINSYIEHAAGRPRRVLSTNYRSDPLLIAGSNLLLEGVELGHANIAVQPVDAVEDRPPTRLSVGAPLQIRRLRHHPALTTRNSPMSDGKVGDAVLADLTHVLGDLFQSDIDDAQTGTRRVDPGDVAVLTGAGWQADAVVAALTASGVPAVKIGTDSVLDSPAVAEWRTLLHALERPTDAGRVAMAAWGVFFDIAFKDLDPRGESSALEDLQRRCGEWAAQLSRMPWLAWYDVIRAESGVVPRLLAGRGGERMLTDLDHIAELLAGDLGTARVTPTLVRRRLENLAALSTGQADAETNPTTRRIDSDSRAVKVSTIHKSKGLEYPIVLLPFLWRRSKEATIFVFNDEEDSRRHVDVASMFGWKMENERNGLPSDRVLKSRFASHGDDLRLLYVALTRARHRTVAWWAPTSTAATTAFSTVLFDRDDDLRPLNTRVDAMVGDVVPPLLQDCLDSDPDDLLGAHLERFAASSDGAIEIHTVDPESEPLDLFVRPNRPERATLEVASGRDVREPAWRRWSFTSLTRHTEHADRERAAGGTDEPIDVDDIGVTTATTSRDMPWADVGGGATFGTLVHDALERVDPTSSTLSSDLDRVVGRLLGRSGLEVEAGVVVDGLLAAMHTPLGPRFGDRRLVDLGPSDRLAELRFDLPLGRDGVRVRATDIGRVLLDTLDPGDRLLNYADGVAQGRFAQHLAGYLQGSIDAVFRLDIDGEQRFVVVDYKTNRLHDRQASDPLAAYSPSLLPAAMADSDYPLQALFYSVALHRYLRWRLPGYEPHRHLGGIGYLYLRGMVGSHTPVEEGCPFGVFEWWPPAAAIVALDDLFATGVGP